MINFQQKRNVKINKVIILNRKEMKRSTNELFSTERKCKDQQRNYFQRKRSENINKGIIFNGKEMKRSTK